MNTHEKLVKLILEANADYEGYESEHKAELVADHLMANGVTIPEGQKPLLYEQLIEGEEYWVEIKCGEKSIILLLVIRRKDDEECQVFSFDREFNNFYPKKEYGKAWRCWWNSPTAEERDDAEWEEEK